MDQTDLANSSQGGLDTFLYRLDNIDGVGVAELTEDDIIRNKIISKILNALDDKPVKYH